MLNANNPEDLKSLEKCRNIVNEIVNFGINDNETKKIIELLSLELEDTNFMKKINFLVKEDSNVKEKNKNKLIF
tara:strand:- start:877 stop:1098 length:222 start_codon:yes stop_codon:yes gene_type:complete